MGKTSTNRVIGAKDKNNNLKILKALKKQGFITSFSQKKDYVGVDNRGKRATHYIETVTYSDHKPTKSFVKPKNRKKGR